MCAKDNVEFWCFNHANKERKKVDLYTSSMGHPEERRMLHIVICDQSIISNEFLPCFCHSSCRTQEAKFEQNVPALK